MINKYRMTDLHCKMFRELLLRKKHYNCILPCGSFFELPMTFVLNNITDIDMMYSIENIVALQDCDDIRKLQNFKNLHIKTSSCHIGFARILHSLDGIVFYKRPQQPRTARYSGPSKEMIMNFKKEWKFFHNFLKQCDRKWVNQPKVKVDFVYALRCPSWPVVANEWRTRQRENGWPSIDVIDKIIHSGCHLVFKPHPSNPEDDTQWRFSFSQAEVILIQHWTRVQKYIYHILRLIKSEIVKVCGGENKTVLCTYFFKTLMLWACEEKPQEFWREENIETALGQLIFIMIEWLIEKRCPNYFIPGNNMIDYLRNDDNLVKEITLLSNFREYYLLKLLELNEFSSSELTLHLELPNKLWEIILLIIVKWSSSKTSEWSYLESCLRISDNFLPELSYLRQGLQIQLSSIASKSENLNAILDAFQLFQFAKNNADESVSITVLPVGLSIVDFMQYICKTVQSSKIKTDTRDGYETIVSDLGYFTKIINCRCEYQQSKGCWHCCYMHGGKQHNRISMAQSPNGLSLSDLRMTGAEAKLQTAQTFLQPFLKTLTHDWRSSSFFNVAAYQANCFYTCLHDYKSAIEQCKEARRYLNMLKDKTKQANTGKLQNLLDVILVNDWSIMFDDHLQVLLGFLTLAHRYRCSTQNRTRSLTRIVVHLFTMEFLQYIHFQSFCKLNGMGTMTYKCDFKDAVRQLFHEDKNHRAVSRILMLTAIRISGIKPKRIGETFYEVQWPC